MKPKNSITGNHADIRISDSPPTKIQMFFHKINPFKSRERELVYKLFKKRK